MEETGRLSEQVDVIVPNYNKAQYVKECLQSLLNQTYPHWRCIVIDGYSDDGSWETIQQIAQNESRFELHQLERIGLYKSWNFGLDKIKSPYFAILTSDDIWEQDWLEKAIAQLNTYPNAIAVAARTCRIDADSDFQSVAPVTRMGERLFAEYDSSSVLRPGPLSSMACYFFGPIYTSAHSLVHRTSRVGHMRFATDVGTIADREWYMRLGLEGDVAYLRDTPAYLRCYPDQLTRQSYKKREEVGRMVRRINERNRANIAEQLGEAREVFLRKSDKYNGRYFDYFYRRPSKVEMKEAPVRSISKFVKLAREYPTLTVRELVFYFTTRKKLIDEKRISMAECVRNEFV